MYRMKILLKAISNSFYYFKENKLEIVSRKQNVRFFVIYYFIYNSKTCF